MGNSVRFVSKLRDGFRLTFEIGDSVLKIVRSASVQYVYIRCLT